MYIYCATVPWIGQQFQQSAVGDDEDNPRYQLAWSPVGFALIWRRLLADRADTVCVRGASPQSANRSLEHRADHSAQTTPADRPRYRRPASPIAIPSGRMNADAQGFHTEQEFRRGAHGRTLDAREARQGSLGSLGGPSVPTPLARGVLRVSLGPTTTELDVDSLINAWIEVSDALPKGSHAAAA
jgi:hypothetical protein